MKTDISPTGLSRGMTLLFAASSAAAVGNLYWAQPLLGEIAKEFQISAAESGTLMTVTQLGYALGVLLLVPLGDSLNRRRFIPLMMGLAVLGLVLSALAPNYIALLFGLTLVGVASVSGQLVLPLALTWEEMTHADK
jgi:predicted MFS family arabinose efflux permease